MIRITICDKNRLFVQTLSDYLNEKYKDYMNVMAFDDDDIFLKFNLEHEVKVSIISSDLYEKIKMKMEETETHIILLNDHRTGDGIFKFQSVMDIGKTVFNECVELGIISGMNMGKDRVNNTTIYGFYAPFSDLCETILALCVAKQLSKEKKVLYLNFHPFSWINQIFQRDFHQDLLDLVFFLNEEQERFHLRLQGMVDTVEDIDYIAPAFSYVDLEETDGKVWDSLIEKLCKERYDVIILDLPIQMRGLLSVLEKCTEIFISEANNIYHQESYNQFIKMLGYMKKESVLNHISRFSSFHITQFTDMISIFSNQELSNQARELMNQHDRK